MKCASCGNQSSTAICDQCKQNTIQINQIVLKACVDCGKIQSNNSWYPRLRPALIKKTKPHGTLADIEHEDIKPGKTSLGTATLLQGNDKFTIDFEIQGTYCERCRKKQGDYFEAIIQIRHERPDITQTLQSLIRKKDLYCSKQVKKDSGTDYFVADTQLAVQCVKELQKKYGGKVTISKKIHGKDRQSSKNTYRVTVLFSALLFKKGDIISYQNHPVVIESVGKTIRGRSLLRKRAMTIEPGDYETLPSFKTKIAKLIPQMEIFDPITFQPVILKGNQDVTLGEEVKVVLFKGLYYLV